MISGLVGFTGSALAALLFAAQSASAAVHASDAQSMLAEMVRLGGTGPIQFSVEPAGRHDGLILDGHLFLSARTLNLVRDQQELAGVMATLVAFQEFRSASGSSGDEPSIGSYAVAGAVAAAGSRLDKVDKNDPSTRNRQAFSRPEPSDPSRQPTRDEERASRALRLTRQAGSCAGPLVDVLKRLVDDDTLAAAGDRPVIRLARRALKSFGASIYPPDRSCNQR